MRKWLFFKTAGARPDLSAEPHVAHENSLKTRSLLQGVDGAGARRIKERIAGWYLSFVRKRRSDRGAGAD